MANELFRCVRVPAVELEARFDLLDDFKKILAAFESCIDGGGKTFVCSRLDVQVNVDIDLERVRRGIS
jgi:hypothetical protein